MYDADPGCVAEVIGEEGLRILVLSDAGATGEAVVVRVPVTPRKSQLRHNKFGTD